MRVRIAVTVSQAVREVERGVLEGWLNQGGAEFEKFVKEVCGWEIQGKVVKVPSNKENKAEGTVIRENVKFDRKSELFFCVTMDGMLMPMIEFSRLIKRAYEQPA